MGADFYLETFVIVKFKDAARNSERILIETIPSWLDDLEDGQEYNKTIIYENSIWNVQINYNIHLNLNEIQKIEEIISVRERF